MNDNIENTLKNIIYKLYILIIGFLLAYTPFLMVTLLLNNNYINSFGVLISILNAIFLFSKIK